MNLNNRVCSTKKLVLFSVAVVLGIIVGVVAVVYFRNVHQSINLYQELNPPDVDTLPPPSYSILGNYDKAVVVANGEPCAVIGRQILEKNGSVVDALIATMLCDGIMCPQSMGIGGGFLMTLYLKAKNSVVTLNARESAPAAATQDMYNGSETASRVGALAIAVPGEIKGYYEAWKSYGNLNWSELFEPTIKMCEEGIPVNQHLADNLATSGRLIQANKALSDIFVMNGTMVKKGDNFTLPKLAQTMRVIANSTLKGDELYKGNLTEKLVKDIQNGGGIITMEDLNTYEVEWGEPVVANLSGGVTMYSFPPPGSGVLVGFILRILDGYLQNATNDLQIMQRITEAFKHAYGRRSDLGDAKFYNISQVMQDLASEEYILQTRNKISDTKTSQDATFYGAHYAGPSDHGTANIVVVAPNGDTAVATSTVNHLFGSRYISESTGIILNNEMDDFSSSFLNYFGIPPSPANYIQPGKRPLSSMSPTIFIDSNTEIRLALGGAGGTKITTSTAFVSMQNLWFNKNIKEAVDTPRIHHQLEPMILEYEYGTLREVAKNMAEIGHILLRRGTNYTWGSCITAAARNEGKLQGNVDFRRVGGMDGF